jgi:A/G-specific adenine glycosylase
MQVIDFQNAVLAWFDRHGRKNLPWQIDRTPYRVWVSEIMLQQTQVATVIPYFERFMVRFPDVRSLADASLDEVTALWAGLGYYARARNLHRAAQRVVENHGGTMPNDPETLADLPGIGRSTAGAILSLGFGIRAAILDGNVKRVLCRHAGLEGWPGETRISRELWRLSEARTPEIRTADYNQAMMDLGATLCSKRRPACERCPVRTGCAAHRAGLTEVLPTPKPRQALPVRECLMLVLRDGEGGIYLEQRPPVGLWGGLWTFPEFEDESRLRAWCTERGIAFSGFERLPQRRHTFSHYHLDYVPVLARGEAGFGGVAEGHRQRWLKPGEEAGVPAPVQRLLDEFATHEKGGKSSGDR